MTCEHCHATLDTDEPLRYGTRLVSRQTHWSPAEYDEVGPLCADCWTEGTRERDDAYERAAARYDGEGKDWR